MGALTCAVSAWKLRATLWPSLFLSLSDPHPGKELSFAVCSDGSIHWLSVLPFTLHECSCVCGMGFGGAVWTKWGDSPWLLIRVGAPAAACQCFAHVLVAPVTLVRLTLVGWCHGGLPHNCVPKREVLKARSLECWTKSEGKEDGGGGGSENGEW